MKPGELGIDGEFKESTLLGNLTAMGKCLRLNHELPAPFLVMVRVASKDLDRLPEKAKKNCIRVVENGFVFGS